MRRVTRAIVTSVVRKSPLRIPARRMDEWRLTGQTLQVARRVTLFAAGLLAVLGQAQAAPVEAQAAPFCPAGRAPAFSLGFATMQSMLGPTMGQALDCEHPNFANGDVLQQTTTGLAYWRSSTNISVFTTDGIDHWSLSPGGLMSWSNSSVEPPQPTPAEAQYLETMNPLVTEIDGFRSRLASEQQKAANSGVDSLSVADVGSIVDGLAAASDSLAALAPPSELSTFHKDMLVVTNASSVAADSLVRAQLNQDAVTQTAFLAQAAVDLSDAAAARNAAREAYGTVLPIPGP